MLNKIATKKRTVRIATENTNSTLLHRTFVSKNNHVIPEILFITSYPPKECGIATYSQDLIKSLKNKFKKSFDLKICALQLDVENHQYPIEVEYTLNINSPYSFLEMAKNINDNPAISMVLLQHEFGFFKYN